MPHKAPEEDHLQKDGNLAGKLILDQVHAIKMLLGFDIRFQVLTPCSAVLHRDCEGKTGFAFGSIPHVSCLGSYVEKAVLCYERSKDLLVRVFPFQNGAL